MTLLAGQPNLFQKKALNDIPDSIGTLEKKLNLQIRSVPHAVCKPLKTYHHYSFHEWFGRFIAQPGIEQYGDKFCVDVSGSPDVMQSFKDGTFVRTFRTEEGELFISDCGKEGRWLFLLHADSFNVEGNRIRGKSSSTGVTCLACLNLPLSMRYDPAWLYIPGIVQGPHEPDAKHSENRHYWRLLVTELAAAYSRG
ncbi:hypothetical protein C8R42DRAFT_568696, partial [Lentinula raphanica]